MPVRRMVLEGTGCVQKGVWREQPPGAGMPGKQARGSSPRLWLMPGYAGPYQSGHMEGVGTGRSRAETFQTGFL